MEHKAVEYNVDTEIDDKNVAT